MTTAECAQTFVTVPKQVLQQLFVQCLFRLRFPRRLRRTYAKTCALGCLRAPAITIPPEVLGDSVHGITHRWATRLSSVPGPVVLCVWFH